MGNITGIATDFASTIIPGGAAGLHVILGGHLDDTMDLLAVIQFSEDMVTRVDLTAEFSIDSAHNTIDNTGGTNTTGDFLLVAWKK